MENEREPYYCDVPGHEDEELSGNADDGWECAACEAEWREAYCCDGCGQHKDDGCKPDCFSKDDDDHSAEGKGR